LHAPVEATGQTGGSGNRSCAPASDDPSPTCRSHRRRALVEHGRHRDRHPRHPGPVAVHGSATIRWCRCRWHRSARGR